MGLTITEVAAKEVKRIIEEQKLENTHLRVGIKGGGCSGFSYDLGFEDDEKLDEKADSVTKQFDIQIVVDKKSMLYLDGTTLDFMEDLSKRGFVFNNPNSVKSCGCGSSFSV